MSTPVLTESLALLRTPYAGQRRRLLRSENLLPCMEEIAYLKYLEHYSSVHKSHPTR